MKLADRLRFSFLRRPYHRDHQRSSCDPGLERLEDRCLLAATVVGSLQELDLVGRDAAGIWQASSPTGTPGILSHRVFATWNPAADWRHVRSGDFDGDGLDDIAGWDASGGTWFVTLSDPIGSTTLAAGGWSNATAWSDVAAVELTADGIGDDLVGRDQWGNWWAAVANGDGTFHNVLLISWNPAARWRDVRLADIDNNGTTDLVGRTADGEWWAALNHGSLSFTNMLLARWNEAANWRDATVVRGYDDSRDGVLDDFRNAILARTDYGEWWSLSLRSNGSVETRFIAAWNESAGWRDVRAANVIGQKNAPPGGPTTGEEVVGRTAAGEWWALDPRTPTSTKLFSWDESLSWRDVHVVTVHSSSQVLGDDRGGGSPVVTVSTWDDRLIGRTAGGEWWIGADRLGSWDESRGWRDVHTADRLGGVPVEVRTTELGFPSFVTMSTISIYAHRTGTSVRVTDLDPPGTAGGRVSIRYIVPTIGYDETFVMPWGPHPRIVFAGHDGGDSYVSRTAIRSHATGGGGDDLLDARNGEDGDELFGGPDITSDLLLGDPGDTLVQD